MPVHIGLFKRADDCSGKDVECRRQRWSWEDGTPYDNTVYHHWNDKEGGNNKYFGNPLFIEPQSGEQLCAGLNAGVWYGLICDGIEINCACKKKLTGELWFDGLLIIKKHIILKKHILSSHSLDLIPRCMQ